MTSVGVFVPPFDKRDVIRRRVSDLPIDLGDVIIDPTLLYPIGDIGVEVVVVLQTVGIATRSVRGAFLVAVDAEGTDTEAYPRLGEQDGTFQFPDQGIHVLPAPIVPLRLAVSFFESRISGSCYHQGKAYPPQDRDRNNRPYGSRPRRNGRRYHALPGR